MENKFIRVDEVAQELDVSTSYAYKLIRQLNNELKAKGSVISGNRSGAQSPASRREHSGVGLPFSAGHSRGDDDPVRHVRYAADAGERKDL